MNGNGQTMSFLKTLVLGILPAVLAPGLHAQEGAGQAAQQVRKMAEQAASQSSGPANKPAPAPAKPANAPAAKNPSSSPARPGAPAAKPSAQAAKPRTGVKTSAAAAKPTGKTQTAQAKGARKPAAKRSARVVDTDTLPKETRVAKRDPFEAMIGREQTATVGTTPLPAGKAGLQVSTLRLDGVVRAPNGMIAVVSNPQSRTYFLREGDQLYDGRVEKIAMDGVSFHEVGKDAFGKPIERQVNKRIYASAGEQQ